MRHGDNPNLLTRTDGRSCPMRAASAGSALAPVHHSGYGHIFRGLAPLDDRKIQAGNLLARLATAMREGSFLTPEDENPCIPAGYTYLGQLLVHDLTRFQMPGRELPDVTATQARNVTSPGLDLDCIYGAGPAFAPILYKPVPPGPDDNRYLLRIGKTGPAALPDNRHLGFGDPFDIPRIAEDSPGLTEATAHACADPLIADSRNDDHVIISQLHLLFARLHNKTASLIRSRGHDNQTAYREARRFLVSGYNSVIRNDFLPRVLCRSVWDDICSGRFQFVRLPKRTGLLPAQLPMEFALAVGRFGHAMVRGQYRINGYLTDEVTELEHVLDQSAFTPSGRSAMPLPTDWVVDWSNFFEIGNGGPQPSRKIGPFLANHFLTRRASFQDPGGDRMIETDLRRSYQLGLPSGQTLARRIRRAFGTGAGVDVPILTGDRLLPVRENTGQHVAVAEIRDVMNHNPFLLNETPLFLYVLLEAHRVEKGLRLGPVGSYVLAVTVVRALGGAAAVGCGAIRGMPDLISLIGYDADRMAATVRACTGFDIGAAPGRG